MASREAFIGFIGFISSVVFGSVFSRQGFSSDGRFERSALQEAAEQVWFWAEHVILVHKIFVKYRLNILSDETLTG